MFEFAQRVGWELQKRDEELINDFCSKIGVKKWVLKIWMQILNLMELAEFRTVSELTVSNSPDILKNYLSSFTETDTETVGSSYLTDMPQIRYNS
ncbi:Zinc-finger homeodomain protein 10 [Capsicum baccatum]|uniref:Zinc-finger homeodomain protein 10 n=1 Tax=Capsicum baccatum TaxID=33114 RepID=A0A2G2VKC0_CAPBA|nr:Zinc-finger homeodomain protein 10 [Capsicum baccatum]